MFFSNFNDKIKKIMRDEEFQNKLAEQKANESNSNLENNQNRETEQQNNSSYNQESNIYEQNNKSDNNDVMYEAQTAEAKTIFDNLVMEDKEFSQASFKAKADNIFIQLYTAVMKQDLQRVKHFLSDEVYAKYEQKVNQLKANNQLQIYDELNVSDTNITNVVENDEEFKLYVNLLTKYLDYVLAKDTRAYLHGNRDVRTEKRVNLVFTKTKRAKELKAARTCPCCGANLDLNKTGVCEYCGSVFKLKDYDWVLTEIDD